MIKKKTHEEIAIELVMETLNMGGSKLIFGNPKKTSRILKGSYDIASKNTDFLCSFHNASKIESPLDFFIPILRLKYGELYEKITPVIEELSQSQDEKKIFDLVDFCGQDLEGKTVNVRKMPVIFIEGMEKLLFKFDFSHLKKQDYVHIPQEGSTISLRFGDHLRGGLHQANKAIFCGSVLDNESIEYKATFGNYMYQFYSENFSITKV